MNCDLCHTPRATSRCPLSDRAACLDRARGSAHEKCDVVEAYRTAFDALLTDALADRARVVAMLRSEAARWEAMPRGAPWMDLRYHEGDLANLVDNLAYEVESL